MVDRLVYRFRLGKHLAKQVTVVGAGTTGRTRSLSTSRSMCAASVSTRRRLLTRVLGLLCAKYGESTGRGLCRAGERSGEGAVQGVHDGRGLATAASWRGLATVALPCR
jgi:hypothetical protein